MSSGFDDFVETLSRYRRLITWVTVSAIALPVAAYQVSLSPPWPNGIVLITALIQIVLAVMSFQLSQQASRRTITRYMSISFIVIVIASITYLLLASQLTFFGGPAKEHLVKGLMCTSDAVSVFGDSCPFLTDQQIGMEERVERLWTPTSITASRGLLLIFWLLSVSAFSFLLVTMIVFQSQREGKFVK